MLFRSTWRLPIIEDNLNVMYKRMLGFFDSKKEDALTLQAYKPVADTIGQAQSLWEDAVK